MIKSFKIPGIGIAAAMLFFTACKKADVGTPATVNADTSLTLKAAAQYQVGVAVDNTYLLAGGTYTDIIKTQFGAVTPGYIMKHGAMVQNNGAKNYTTADNFVNWATTNNLAVNGHTLAWHQNNNGNYLRSLLALPSSTPGVNPSLIPNGSFEDGTASTVSTGGYGGVCTSWTAQIQGSSDGSVSITTAAGEVNNGARALKVVVNAVPANGYQFQVFPPDGSPTLTSGTAYKIGFYAKHTGATTPKIRVQTQSGGYQTNDVTVSTTWTKYSVTLTPSGGDASRFNFQFLNTGTYFIDSVSLTLATPTAGVATFAEKQLRIDTAFRNYITAMVTHYKDKVHAWDVVNEPIDDAGILRTGTSVSDAFYWGDYLGDRDATGKLLTNGDSLVTKAFRYARAADPTAKLFINDYGQESGTIKTDSLLNLIKRVKAAGVSIDGIGLQMHINYNTPTTNIDNALMKTGRLGLLVKISELDVSVNLGSETDPNTKNYVIGATTFAQQASMYKNVAESYFKNIPAAQRFGITIWGVHDSDSWLIKAPPSYHTVDYPLLFDGNYNKKPAFYEFSKGLQLR